MVCYRRIVEYEGVRYELVDSPSPRRTDRWKQRSHEWGCCAKVADSPEDEPTHVVQWVFDKPRAFLSDDDRTKVHCVEEILF